MKKLFFIFIYLVIGIGFILASLELFLRLNPKLGYVYNTFRFKSDTQPLRDWQGGTYRLSRLLGYELIPHSRSNINSYGLIGKEYNIKKYKNTFRILLLGDSIAAQDWSARFLEEELNNNLQLNSKYKFEIWNAGVASYDVRKYFLFLKYKGLNFSPDMVIIFLFMNDFKLNLNIYFKDKDGRTEYCFPTSGILQKYIPDPFLMRYSFLYRFIILKLDAYLLSKKKMQDINRENGIYFLGMVKDICARNKIPLFLVIFPYLRPLREYDDRQRDEYQTVYKVVKDLKVEYLNLFEYLPEDKLYMLRGRIEDDAHPSVEGCRAIAKIIYDNLLNNFFIHTHFFTPKSGLH